MTMRIGGVLAAAVLIAVALPARAQETYPTPEAAVKDLVDSAKAKTPGFGDRILGKEGAALLRSGDTDQDAENLKEFNEAAAASTAIDDGPNGAKILRVGKNGWTLPLPLIKSDAGWRFDAAKGKEEMTNRRVGYNELSAIEACKAYVAAQDEYFKLDRDGNGLREYARKIISTPGTHDGLYWPPENQADISPLDGFAEDARSGWAFGREAGALRRLLLPHPDRAGTRGAGRRLFLPHQRPHDRRLRDDRLAGGLRRQRRQDFYLRREWRRLPKGPRAEHRRSRRLDGPVQSRRELESRRVAATQRELADRSDARNSWASFSQAATGREPKGGEADNLRRLNSCGRHGCASAQVLRIATRPKGLYYPNSSEIALQ